MSHVGEVLNPPKLGTQLLGKHIPIVDHRWIIEERRDYLILHAWHLTEAIARRVRQEMRQLAAGRVASLFFHLVRLSPP
jgi:hypothetical protein